MKKILLGFIAIGLFTFVGCEKDDDSDTETTDSTETSSDDGTTDDSSSSITDADGNVYTSVTIGEQEWMVENLKTSKYNDGTAIPNVTENTEWEDLTTGAWSHYDNDNQHNATYGKLYNWYAVNTSKLCPTGWHVPTDAEWTVLTDYLAVDGHSGTEGTALKATSGWDNKDDVTSGNGTDDYGWNGLPGGNRSSNGNFYYIGYDGSWWSSSLDYANNAWSRYLYSNDGYVYRDDDDENYGFSVRCLRD